jgi:murein DD-endopeptidase MepM/ murein hydrolase activator NlpD
MKPSYEELEQKLAESQREFRAADATIENLQMQLNAEREAKLALAVENAGLKSIQAWAVADVFKSGAKRFESTKAAGFDTDDCLHDAVLVMLSELKTQATDAFLAEVRAQGVDSAINTVIAMMNHQHPVTSKAIDIMRVHAYQLRKGGATEEKQSFLSDEDCHAFVKAFTKGAAQ